MNRILFIGAAGRIVNSLEIVMAELKALVAKRAVQKAALTRLDTWLKNPGDEPDLYTVEARMRILDRTIDAYEEVQEQIEELDHKDMDRAEMEIKVSVVDASLRRLRHTLSNAQAQDAVNQSIVQLGQNLAVTVERFDDISRPKAFDGEDYLEWPVFANSFETLIHEHQRLNAVNKFSILRECLKGKAYNAIMHLPLNEEGYDEARKILRARYDKKRLLFSSLIQKILQIERAEKPGDTRGVYDKVIALTKALEAIPATKEQIGYGVLMLLILGKIDRGTAFKWEESGCDPSSIPSWNDFIQFLDARCNSIESVAFSQQNQEAQSNPAVSLKTKSAPNTSYLVTSSGKADSCTVCKGDCTNLENCSLFLSQSPRSRFRLIKRNHRCVRCLRSHPNYSQGCNERCNVPECGKYHHFLLHFDKTKMRQRNQNKKLPTHGKIKRSFISETSSVPPDNVATTSTVNVIKNINKPLKVLATAVIKVKSSCGDYLTARALIDSGSMDNFVTQQFAERLNVKTTRQNTQIKGLFSAAKLTHGTSLQIKSCHSEFATAVEAVVLPKFEDYQPKTHFPVKDLKIPDNISRTLADPKFNDPQRIDVILGVGLAFSILAIGQGQLSNGLILQNTKLGWLVAGNVVNIMNKSDRPHANNSPITASSTSTQKDKSIQIQSLKKNNSPGYSQSSDSSESMGYKSLSVEKGKPSNFNNNQFQFMTVDLRSTGPGC